MRNSRKKTDQGIDIKSIPEFRVSFSIEPGALIFRTKQLVIFVEFPVLVQLFFGIIIQHREISRMVVEVEQPYIVIVIGLMQLLYVWNRH
jgi:hypothetical protein